LIGHIAELAGLESAVGGNIGTPASALPKLSDDGLYILEVSSYQLDLLNRTKFNIAALLNITPDHIDRHGSMEGYIESKKKIFDRQGADDSAIIAVDDSYTEEIYQPLSTSSAAKVVHVSASKELKSGVFIKDRVIYNRTGDLEEKFELGDIKRLPGEHNLQNIAIAFTVLRSVGIDGDLIIAGVQSFPGLEHRMQHVAEIAGVKYVNDSKATNAVAAEKALASFDNIYWLAGGVAKEGGISSLESLFPKIKKAFLFGEARDKFAVELEGKVDTVKFDSLDEAFTAASKEAEKGGVVLLSPACASFDQFKNFEERGKRFCTLIRDNK
jgi:UDP-N-acetylmuramoylalanine--D-glutamate ligase